MAKELILFGVITEYNTMYFFDQIKSALEKEADASFAIRVNCRGGNPEYSMSIINRVQQMEGATIQVDGMAHSMAAFLLCYVKDASCLDTAQFLFHRASYGEYSEGREDFKGSTAEQSLVKTNKDLKKAFVNSVNVEAFEALKQCKDKNITVESMFSMEDRQEVLLSPADMKKIGLIKKIVKVTPEKSAEIVAMYDEYKGCSSIDEYKKAAESTAPKPEPKNTAMTLEELKAQNPALYAQIKAEGKAEETKNAVDNALTEERDRVGAWMAFKDVDQKAVEAGIASGKKMTMTEQNQFLVKMNSKKALSAVEDDSTTTVSTEEVEVGKGKEKTEKKQAAFEASVDAELGLPAKK